MEKANAKDYLGKEVSIEIDRPMGTRHPKHGFMYMINYGFIPNTISGDGEELDAYLVKMCSYNRDVTFIPICHQNFRDR